MPSSELPPLIRALLDLSVYPHPATSVDLVQTHVSYVLLAGEYVYKIKKPVHFAFVDYSTLGKRLHFCQEEVRLNRRLSPTVYLRVVPIIAQEGRFVLAEGPVVANSEQVTEYAVKMR